MQNILSPAHEKKISIEKLVQIPVEKIKEKLLHLGSEERIRYAGTLFEGNGWTIAYHKKGQQADTILLSYPKAPDNIVLMVRLDVREQELSYEEVREHLLYFENELAPQYQCRQFCLVAFNGYESKAEHLEDFNLLLQKWSYMEELHLNYSSDKIREPRIQLFAHNKQTYKKVQRMMQQTNAVAVVQATGTGKSYLIAKLLQDFNGTKRLVMAPSTFIIEQIKEHIRWEVDKIQFMTYAKGMNLSESEIKALQSGMIVLDEFHRCGAEEWGRGVQNIINAYPSAFKFGTSATPIRYLDNRRDMAKELFEGNIAENLSLAQAITRNILPMPKYVCALYTLKEEADNMRELIKKSRKNEEAKQKILLELDTLTLDWERSHGIPQVLKKHWRKHMGKFIVFCENEKHLLETEPMVVGWFKEATENLSIKTYRIYDGEPNSQENLEAIKNTKEKDMVHLLFSINMLNEGLHVNEVSGVVLLRPTESPNIFYQQIGRCLKVGASHTPVIFDFVNNFKSVRTHDFMYDLQEAKRFHAETRKEQDLKDLCPEFSIIDEVREITEVFGEIEFRVDDWEAMYERLVAFKERFGHCNVPQRNHDSLHNWLYKQRKQYKNGLLSQEHSIKLSELGVEWRLELMRGSPDEVWQKNFESLCEFRKVFGHCTVTDKYKNDKKFFPLVNFCAAQRERFRNGTLEEYRIEKLNAIGFEWDRSGHMDGLWQKRFDELVAFKTENGHCIPHYQTDRPLFSWVSKQREYFWKGTLDPLRKQKLDSIGMEWGDQNGDALFEKRYAEMIAYKEQHGSVEFTPDSKLGKYARWLKQLFRKGKLDNNKLSRLNSLGLDLQINKTDPLIIRKERLLQLQQFFDKHGHGNVPFSYPDLPALGTWVASQRKQYKKGTLPQSVIQQLERLKVDLNLDIDAIAWEEKYQALVKYHNENGTVSIKRDEKDKTLSLWSTYLRERYKAGKLTDEQIEKLNRLGFEWNFIENYWDRQWEERYSELVVFKEKFGHMHVSQRGENNKLGVWLTNTRKYYKNGALSADRIKRLEALGFMWDVFEEEWQSNFENLKQSLAAHGWKNLVKDNSLLNHWVARQRRVYHKGKLPENKIMLLNQLGIEWSPMKQLWDSMYEQLLRYKEKNGTSHVLVEDPDHPKLGRWCSAQRQNYKKKTLSPEQIQLLNNISFPWEIDRSEVSRKDDAWHNKYHELLQYLSRNNGSFYIPEAPEMRKLVIWCRQQRNAYKQNKLTPQRLQLLNTINFPWSVPKAGHPQYKRHWNKSYSLLVEYHKRTGKGWVAPQDAADSKELKSLYAWCSNIRNYYWENKLTPEQVKLLEALDFPFERRKPRTKPLIR